MNATTKVQSPAVHNLFLYRKALHPELFQMKARRAISHGTYDLEAWLMNGSHMLRFQHRAFCLSELLSEKDSGLPTAGAVASFPCLGEKDYEHPFASEHVHYITTMQTETLSENLYRSTYQEMLAFASETNAMVVKWSEPAAVGAGAGVGSRQNGHSGHGGGGAVNAGHAGKNLSILDIQRFSKEVHAQSYHLFAASGLVLRTQTIFEHK
jgi:hypothetical protein